MVGAYAAVSAIRSEKWRWNKTVPRFSPPGRGGEEGGCRLASGYTYILASCLSIIRVFWEQNKNAMLFGALVIDYW